MGIRSRQCFDEILRHLVFLRVGIPLYFGLNKEKMSDKRLFVTMALNSWQGQIRAVNSIVPLEEIAPAHRAFEAGGGYGKRVIKVTKS